MNIALRTASKTDAAIIADFARKTFEAAFGPDNDPEDMRAYLDESFTRARIKSDLAVPGVVYLLAYAEKELIGYVKLAAGPPPDHDAVVKPVEVSRIYVASHMLGRGIGTRLMQLTLRECRQLGYETVWLGVWDRNRKARKFYERCGYRKIGKKSFILGSDMQDDAVYLLDLGQVLPKATAGNHGGCHDE